MAVKGKAASKAPKRSHNKMPEESVSMKEQEQQVLDIGGQVEAPPEEVVKNNQFAVEFVRPRFEKNKHGHLVGFDFSVNLAEGHMAVIPTQVQRRYREVLQGGVPRLDMSDIKPQVINVALFPEDGKPAGSEIALEGCVIKRARVQEIVSKSSGKETRSIRFSFTAYIEQDKENTNFAAWKHAGLVWISLADYQGELSFGEEESAE